MSANLYRNCRKHKTNSCIYSTEHSISCCGNNYSRWFPIRLVITACIKIEMLLRALAGWSLKDIYIQRHVSPLPFFYVFWKASMYPTQLEVYESPFLRNDAKKRNSHINLRYCHNSLVWALNSQVTMPEYSSRQVCAVQKNNIKFKLDTYSCFFSDGVEKLCAMQ